MSVPTLTETSHKEMPEDPISFKVIPPATNHAPLLVRLQLDKAQPLTIELYDVAGRQISHLALEQLAAGAHTLAVATGNIAKGLYLVQLRTQTYTVCRSIHLF